MKLDIRLASLVILFAAAAAGSAHAASLSGFDGLPWGTPATAVSGESREMMGGAVLAKRIGLSALKETYHLDGAYKVYYFCDGTLCGGKLSLVFGRGFQQTSVDTVITHMKAIVGSAYGHIGQPNRLSDDLWSISGSIVSVAPVMQSDHSVVEVFYRGPVYLQTLAKSERSLNAKLSPSVASWKFNF